MSASPLLLWYIYLHQWPASLCARQRSGCNHGPHNCKAHKESTRFKRTLSVNYDKFPPGVPTTESQPLCLWVGHLMDGWMHGSRRSGQVHLLWCKCASANRPSARLVLMAALLDNLIRSPNLGFRHPPFLGGRKPESETRSVPPGVSLP